VAILTAADQDKILATFDLLLARTLPASRLREAVEEDGSGREGQDHQCGVELAAHDMYSSNGDTGGWL
jgi:hypothetical protein